MNDKLVVENVYKVFGPDPERAIELARSGCPKDAIFSETGSVLAVNDVSMRIPERSIFVVMGLSGSGKSTLIRCFNRLHDPTSGRIRVDGVDITGLDGEALRQFRLHRIAMVFQHFALLPHRTVAENAEYGLKVRGVAVSERRDKALEALEAVGLGAWADVYPDSLSGGMQQRVGLARALAVDPEILLMDEPFSALDPLIRREMQDELLAIQERYKTTIVFITHDLHEALKLGDQVAIMKDGRFVQVGRPQEIVVEPRDPYVCAFTQDVDRARVLTAGRLAEDVPAVVLDGARGRPPETVGSSIVPCIEPDGRFAGFFVSRSGRLEREVPVVRSDDLLLECFGRIDGDLPLAVVDRAGRYVGVLALPVLFEAVGPQSELPDHRPAA